MENTSFYIFTGGPGSGKSTVLDILNNLGHTILRRLQEILFESK